MFSISGTVALVYCSHGTWNNLIQKQISIVPLMIIYNIHFVLRMPIGT